MEMFLIIILELQSIVLFILFRKIKKEVEYFDVRVEILKIKTQFIDRLYGIVKKEDKDEEN